MEKLGIDPFLLGVQIINFIILFVILKKVLYKPILKAMKSREEKLAGVETAMGELARKQEVFESTKEKVLKAARSDANNIVNAARLEAQKIKNEATEEGNKKARALIAKGQGELDRQAKLVKRNVKESSKKLSQEVINHVLARVLDDKTRLKSIALVAKELKS